MSRFWKDAATLLLIRRSASASQHKKIKDFNYKILMLERSSKSSFMPSAYVFPGGKLGQGDLSTSWMNMLQSSSSFEGGSGKTDSGLWSIHSDFDRPPALTAVDDKLSRDLAFRICAIRETFEEVGILVGQGTNGKDLKISPQDLEDWRPKIQKDDTKFIEMCKSVQIIPDVWSLYEYCNWLTPTNLTEIDGKGRRFDTIFYMTFLDECTEAAHDDQEIVASQWYHPYDMIEDHYAKKIWLAPPQLYELLRLFSDGMRDYDTLQDFMKERSRKSIARWLPVRINCTDGIISVLPGDELFPEDPDYEGVRPAPELSQSIEEARQQTCRHNRIEIRSLHDMIVVCNIDTGHGHPNPVNWPLS